MRLLPAVLVVVLLGAAAGLPQAVTAQTGPLVIPAVPVFRQQHSLTCESSAASMATRGQIVESQLMSVMPRSANPNLGFRGNPDGLQGTKLVDYGVYAAPLQQALARYGYASSLISYGFDRDIKSFINRGWPVVAWITYALQKATPRLVMHRGVQFVLVPHEHAITIVGYDDRTIIGNDPATGQRVRYFWGDFNRAWGYFGNMALAIEPCRLAVPVDRVNVTTLNPSALTWTWARAVGAAHYAVSVTRYGAVARVVYNATQDVPTYTVTNPSPGKTYQISVSSISGCGDVAAAATSVIQVPSDFATPTPSATEIVTTPIATAPTATPTATAAPSSTPVPATATPTPHS